MLAKLVKSLKAKKAEHLDNDAEPNPTVSTLAHIVHYRQEDEVVSARGEPKADLDCRDASPLDRKSELLRLLGELQEKLNHLVVTGGDGNSKEVTRSVREVMKENNFKRKNREAVECDAAMKNFLCELSMLECPSLETVASSRLLTK